MAEVTVKRKTRETDIEVILDLTDNSKIKLETESPFFNHMLNAMSFHGGFSIQIKGSGDMDVDPHHLIEDCGLVIGQAFFEMAQKTGPIKRYGHSIIPMDDALSEITIDACGRPYLVYKADYPQPFAGNFDLSLIREFLLAFSNSAKINLHCECRYGMNGHHMVESLFKAFGRALAQSYKKSDTKSPLSTKGKL